MNSPRIGIHVGHSRPNKEGAVSYSGVSEHNWHMNEVIPHLKAYLKDFAKVKIVSNTPVDSYKEEIDLVAKTFQEFKADIAVALHFNSFDTLAKGYEQLYWHASTNGLKLARVINDTQSHFIPELNGPNRGIKPLTASDAGSRFLRKTHCPAVINEPFFGDNPQEWARFANNGKKYAYQLSVALQKYLNA